MTEQQGHGDGLVTVTVDDGGVALVTLADGDRGNLLSEAMDAALAEACAAIDSSTRVSAAVLTGSAGVFSAGDDLTGLAERAGGSVPVPRALHALRMLAVPLIGAVNGPAVGAGLNVALACDVLVAGESARFGSGFLAAGMHPGGGHLWRLTTLLGRQAAAAMALCGEELDAEQARAAGLVWQVVADAEVGTAASRLAAAAARPSRDLVRRTKASLRASLPLTDERTAEDLEQIYVEWSVSRAEFAAAVQRRHDGSDGPSA